MPNPSIEEVLNTFKGRKVLVVGDAMLDCFTHGNSTQQSPEANVPILKVNNRKWAPGGAANVAVHFKNLGATPLLVALIGNDEHGVKLKQQLEYQEISTQYLVYSSRKTTFKERLFIDGVAMVRVDDEDDSELSSSDSSRVLANIQQVIDQVDLILIQDYDKGCMSDELIRCLTTMSKELQIPIAIDPKKTHFQSYTDVALFKPNRMEFEYGVGKALSSDHNQNLSQIDAFRIRKGIDSILVTLGEEGVYGVNATGRFHVQARPILNPDVTGAGDAFIAIASLAYAAGLFFEQIIHLANDYASLACENPGIVSPDINELIQLIQKGN